MKNLVKQELSFDGLTIQLLQPKKFADLPYQSESNLVALDSSGKKVWVAEPPITNYEQYFDFEIDKDKALVIASTGGGYRYYIDIKNGKIIDYFLVK